MYNFPFNLKLLLPTEIVLHWQGQWQLWCMLPLCFSFLYASLFMLLSLCWWQIWCMLFLSFCCVTRSLHRALLDAHHHTRVKSKYSTPYSRPKNIQDQDETDAGGGEGALAEIFIHSPFFSSSERADHTFTKMLPSKVSFQKQPRWRWSRWSWRERWSSTQCSTSSPSSSPSWCPSPCSSMSCQSQSVCSLFRFGALLIIHPSRKLFQGNQTQTIILIVHRRHIQKESPPSPMVPLVVVLQLASFHLLSPSEHSDSPSSRFSFTFLFWFSLSDFDFYFHFYTQYYVEYWKWKWNAPAEMNLKNPQITLTFNDNSHLYIQWQLSLSMITFTFSGCNWGSLRCTWTTLK